MHLFRRAALRASGAAFRPYLSKPRFVRRTAVNPSSIQSRIQPNLLQIRSFSDAATKVEDGLVNEENMPVEEAAVETAEVTSNNPSEPAESFVAGQEGIINSGDSVKATDTLSEAPDESNLFVGNLSFGLSEDDLRDIFKEYGEIAKVKMIYDQRGLSKGFGYVTYHDAAAGRAALGLNQTIIEGRRMIVALAERRMPSGVQRLRIRNPPSKTLYVGNLSYEMTDRDLNELFKNIPGVIDVRVAVDRQTGNPRGFAHADFNDVAHAEKGREILSQKTYYGRSLRVDFSISDPGRTSRQDSSAA